MRLEKSIIYFDIESTGLETDSARIVELACIKYSVEGKTEEKTLLFNPGIPIPTEASDVHGITDEMVKDKPMFSRYAKGIRSWFEGCDLAGFNSNNYDVPLLSAEFERAGLEGVNWEPTLVDGLTLYRKLFPNTLSDVYTRLTGKELIGAHGALADITATKEIVDIIFPMLVKQSETVIETPKDVDEYLQGDRKRFDLSGKLYIDAEGVVKYNFGKDKDKSVIENEGFARWMLKQSFPQETKDKIRNLLN